MIDFRNRFKPGSDVFSFALLFFLGLAALCAEETPTSAGKTPGSASGSAMLRLEFLDEKNVSCPGLKRVLVMDPSILEVFKGSDRITLKGIRVGKTSVVIWGAVRQTLSVEVTAPPINVSQQTERIKREREEKHSVALQVDYSFLKENQGETETSPEQSSTIQFTRAQMLSPFLKGTRLGLSGEWNKEEDVSDFRLGNGTLSDITWPRSQRYSVTVGNIGSSTGGSSGSFTDAGAIKGFQAGDFQWAPTDKDQVRFDVSYGVQDKSQKNRFQNSLANSSFLAEPGVSPTDLISGKEIVEKKLARSKWRYSSKSRERQVFGMDPSSTLDVTHVFQDAENSLDPANVFQWDMILASSSRSVHTILGGTQDNLSYSGEYQQILGEFQFKLYHQNVPADTQSVNQNLFERTLNAVNLNYRPKRDLGFLKKNSLTWDFQQDDQKNSSGGDTLSSKVLTHRLDYQGEWEKYTLGLQSRRLDGTDSQNPQIATDYRLSVSRSFRAWRAGLWNISYSSLKTDQLGTFSSVSESGTWSGFVGFNVWKTLNYSLSLTSTTTDQSRNPGAASDSTSVGHSLSYQRSFWKNRVQSFMAYSHSTTSAPSTDEVDTPASESADQDGVSQNVTFGFSGNPNASTLVRVTCQWGSDLLNSGAKHTRSQFEATVSSRFHTLFGWQPKNDIRVVCFVDKDADGKFDENVDSPLPDLEILVNDKPFGKTGEDGKLFLPKVKGFQKTVSLDPKGTPDGFLFSTPSQYEITSESKTEEPCWFGFSINTEVSGLVYNDVNQNGVFDDEDEALPKVSLSLSSGKSTQTDLRGYFYLNMIPEGDCELKVNVLSLPEGFRSTSKVKRQITIQRGSVVRQEFAFQAERVFKGRVLRKTGTLFTQTPVPDVIVSLDGEEKTTDQKGAFKFSNLAAGNHKLRLSFKNLSEPVTQVMLGDEKSSLEASKEWECTLTFEKEPETQDQIVILE